MDNKNNSLKKQAISGAKWVGTANVFVIVLLFIRTAILGRLLEPSDFGLMSMVMVVVNFALVFSDMGVSKAIIQRQNISKDQLSSLYWTNIIIGIIIMLVVSAISPLVAAFYSEKRLISLLAISSLIFPITAIGQQFQVLLEKEMIFAKLALADTLSSLLGTFITIIFALIGYGVLSLIIGQIVIATVKMLYLLLVGLKFHKPIFYFNIKDIKGFLNFGLFQMGESFIYYFNTNVDYILIGRFLGQDALGMYYFAYQIVLMPITRINPILTRVAFPAFSKKQSDNQALNKGYIELIKFIALIVMPIVTGFALVAPVAVPLIFGDKWIDSVILIQIMTLPAILYSLGNPIGVIQLAKGRVDIGFYWKAINFVLYTFLLFLVVRNGIMALSYTRVMLSTIDFIEGFFIIRYLTGLKFQDYIVGIIKPGKFSMIMGITVYILYVVLNSMNVHGYVLLCILVLFGVIAYLLLAFAFDRDYCLDLWNSLICKRRSK